MGEWDTQQETEPRPHQDRQVAALEIHPEFDARNLKNDFAVLFTSQEFELSDHIDTYWWWPPTPPSWTSSPSPSATPPQWRGLRTAKPGSSGRPRLSDTQYL